MADPREPEREALADTRSHATDTGRVNQKLRTRQALVDAARELVGEGATPTLAEVAERALISKTTAYRYFASADALLAEVLFDRDFPSVERVLGEAGDDPTARVLAVEAAINDTMLANEHAMRMLVRNALDSANESADDRPARVGRRQTLIAAALEPLRERLPAADHERLRAALSLVIGPEAIIAARDVCGLSADATRRLTQWAARAIITQALAEQRSAG